MTVTCELGIQGIASVLSRHNRFFKRPVQKLKVKTDMEGSISYLIPMSINLSHLGLSAADFHNTKKQHAESKSPNCLWAMIKRRVRIWRKKFNAWCLLHKSWRDTSKNPTSPEHWTAEKAQHEIAAFYLALQDDISNIFYMTLWKNDRHWKETTVNLSAAPRRTLCGTRRCNAPKARIFQLHSKTQRDTHRVWNQNQKYSEKDKVLRHD